MPASANLVVPRPNTTLKVSSVNPRMLRPVLPPSRSASSAVPLPSRFRELVNQPPYQFNNLYVRTTHIVPAATPRVIGNPEPVPPKGKEAKNTWIKRTTQDVVGMRLAYDRRQTTLEGEDAVDTQLFNVVDRYVLTDQSDRWHSRKALTLLAIHGNGCPRRIWEPALRYLLQMIEAADVEYFIPEIWSFESVNSGDSAMLNSGKLGDLFDWADGSRDQLNFLLHYIPDEPVANGVSPTSLPVHLPPVAEEEAHRRTTHGFRHRTFVAMGHSIGGCALARAAADTPALFSSLILLDPTLVPNLFPGAPYDGRFTMFIMGRMSEWKDRETARRDLARYPPNRAWDPEALDTFVQEGLYDTMDGTVALKLSAFIESVAYMEFLLIGETWELLPTIDERISLRWVMSGKPPESWVAVMTGGLEEHELIAQTVWRRPTNASNVRIKGAGHSIPQEAPKALAEDVFMFLKQKYATPSTPAKL
ncbi:hypothetical protein FRB96_006580 [Tulasnella sp. 330]|nr:hypothetical protein FRB96_006580 [Tulasnella sp. 330]